MAPIYDTCQLVQSFPNGPRSQVTVAVASASGRAEGQDECINRMCRGMFSMVCDPVDQWFCDGEWSPEHGQIICVSGGCYEQ